MPALVVGAGPIRARGNDTGAPFRGKMFNSFSNAGKGPALEVGLWLLTFASAIFLGTRIYCKTKRHRTIHKDDILLIVAWVLSLGSAICSTIEVASFGLGKHIEDIRGVNPTTMIIMGDLSISFTIFSLAASKTSWALTLTRITQGKTRIAIWVAMALSNVLFTAVVFLYWFQCVPLFSAQCLDPRVGMYSSIGVSAYSGLTDLVFAFLPWRILWSLEMKRKDKIGAAFSMSMGVFAGTAAFLKCSAFPELLNIDFTYIGVTLNFLGFLEMAVTIVAASVPMVWTLVRMNSRKNGHKLAT